MLRDRDCRKRTIGLVFKALGRVEEFDKGLLEHSLKVAQVAKDIFEAMGKDTAEQLRIYLAGLMHDVGKIFIPKEILLKEGKLTDEEFDTIKFHSVFGYEVLKRAGLDCIAGCAGNHHFREDGGGYGVCAEDYGLDERVLGVADSFCAMLEKRSYKEGMSLTEACREICDNVDGQFSREVVEVFMDVVIEKYYVGAELVNV